MSNLVRRAITGAVFVAVMVFSIFTGQHAVGFLFAAAAVAGFIEYRKILKSGDLIHPSLIRGLVVVVIIHQSFWQAFALENPKYLLLSVAVLALTAVLDVLTDPKHGFERMISTLGGHLWITLPFASVNVLGFVTGFYEPWIIMGFFILLWINDTGAYLTGRSLGRTKLAPAISPGKTVEGLIGGILFAFGAAWLLSEYTGLLDRTDWLVMAAVVALFSNAGDLVESALKRRCGVKDSGSILPGHGGILDRFDGVLLSVPVIVAYLLSTNL